MPIRGQNWTPAHALLFDSHSILKPLLCSVLFTRREHLYWKREGILHDPQQSQVSRGEEEDIYLRIFQVSGHPNRNRKHRIAQQSSKHRHLFDNAVDSPERRNKDFDVQLLPFNINVSLRSQPYVWPVK